MLLAWLILFWATPVPPAVLTAHTVQTEVAWTPQMVKDLAITEAKKRGLQVKRFLATIECESGFVAKGQSQHYYRGVRENSWGAAQFWLDKPMTTKDGTLITREIAENPEQALDAMAWHFAEGRAHKWTCYNKLYGK